MNRPSNKDTIMIFLLAFLAFAIVFTLIVLLEVIWMK